MNIVIGFYFFFGVFGLVFFVVGIFVLLGFGWVFIFGVVLVFVIVVFICKGLISE